ncbi:hypothetical protein, partial [[Ruminococcus] lactaris]|uniref:hypothetical protein n=4 Tax=[Ruminococcus] lactaris TaxID=46228 RepID=UPI00307C8F89
SCQRAEVKRVLHCDATTSADMDALLSKTFLLLGYFPFDNYKFLRITVDKRKMRCYLIICKVLALKSREC